MSQADFENTLILSSISFTNQLGQNSNSDKNPKEDVATTAVSSLALEVLVDTTTPLTTTERAPPSTTTTAEEAVVVKPQGVDKSKEDYKPTRAQGD